MADRCRYCKKVLALREPPCKDAAEANACPNAGDVIYRDPPRSPRLPIQPYKAPDLTQLVRGTAEHCVDLMLAEDCTPRDDAARERMIERVIGAFETVEIDRA